jgi:hypothetical protein
MVWPTMPDYFVAPELVERGGHWDTNMDVHQEQRRRDQQYIQELEDSWEAVPISPPGLDWSEGPSTNESRSILERVADFLNF